MAGITVKHKIYAFCNGGSRGWFPILAMAEDGNTLAGHICSSSGFFHHDIGITSTWQHDKYNAHYGAGNWEIEWVDNPKNHEGLQAAYALNQELGKQSDPK